MRWFVAVLLTFALFALILAFIPMGAAYYGTQADFLLRTLDQEDIYGRVEREVLTAAGLNAATSTAVLDVLHLRPLLQRETERLLPPVLDYLRGTTQVPPVLDLRPLKEGIHALLSDTSTYMEIMRVHDPDEFLRLQNMTDATRAETIPTLVQMHIDSAGIPQRLDTAEWIAAGGMVDLSWSHQFLRVLRLTVSWFPYTAAAAVILAALLFALVGTGAFWAIFAAFLPASVGLLAIYVVVDRFVLHLLMEELAADATMAFAAHWPSLLMAALLRVTLVYLGIAAAAALLGILLGRRRTAGV